MYCWSSVPSGEIRWTTSIRSGEFLRTVTPMRCTSSGSRGKATETRFCTSTWAWSMLVPGLKTTLIDNAPSPVDCDTMIDHVVDAVDLLLDRRGHGLCDDLGGGARKGRVHHHGRRRNLRIFGDRQRAKRDGADQRQDDRDDAGEDRPVDEEMRKPHGD